MKSASHKYVKVVLTALLALLGFASCSKPEEDPVNSEWNTPMTLYGAYLTSYQDNLPNS